MDQPKKTPLWIEVIGWAGVLALFVAYLLLSNQVIEAGYLFQALNVFGAIAVAIPALSKKNWQTVVLETIWSLIAIAAIIRLALR